MTAHQDEEKYHWIVVFRKGGRIYPYANRTVSFMADMVRRHHDEHDSYPHRMWAIVEDEIQKVVIT